jgi:hypothetical protein
VKQFKFLVPSYRILKYEILKGIIWCPIELRGVELWSVSRSEQVKGWVTDLYNNEEGFEFTKYFPDMDRTCKVIEYGVITSGPIDMFEVTVKIMKSEDEYMILNIDYTIDENI